MAEQVRAEQADTASAIAPERDEPMRFVSLRAVAIACALMPLLAMWVVQSELIWYTGHSTAISLFFHVTFVIFLIGLGNLWIEKRWPRQALSPGEILTIYVMLSIAGTLCSHDLLQIMIPLLTFPRFNANPMNRWEELFLSGIPAWSIVSEKEPACFGLAVGNYWLYRWDILSAWLKPLAAWSVFLMALLMALLFINVFFRKQWTERERLSFPVIQIPLIIATGLRELLRQRLFWVAFGIAAAIDMNNFISFLNPTLPEIPIAHGVLFRDYFVGRPWDSIAHMEINFYPFVIGLAFFLPADLAFSCWFFYLFYKMELLLTSAIGVRDLPGFPFPNEQAAGGYLALGLLAIWLARRHLAGVFRTIFGMRGGTDDSDEPVSYRTAFVGLILSTIVVVVFGVMLGASWPVMVAFFLIFFLYSLAIARMRAELGPPAHDLHLMGPDQLLLNMIGTRGLGKGNLSAFALFFWFNRAYRAHFSAHSIEGFKIAQLSRIASRSMMKAMVVAVVVGILSAYWAMLHSLYRYGYSGKIAGDAFSSQTWMRLENWLQFPKEVQLGATVATALGIVFTLFLGMMRARYTWWFWHPVGFATASSWSMDRLWSCIFLAWVAKVLITRYGGADAYRKAIPFFVGLVMGEFVVGSLWCIWGAVTSTQVYHFWG